MDRLHHGVLGAHALQHGVGADAMHQLLDAGHALVTALADDVGRAKFASELLPRLVRTHRDDPLSPHLLGRKHTEQADRTITHDDNGGSRRHIRRVGGEPAGAHHVRKRQKVSHKVGCRYLRRSDQGAISERDAEYWCLCAG